MSDPITRSMTAAPPGQTVEEWARTTNEGRMLAIMCELTETQQETWLRCLQRLVDGEPVRDAALRMYRECGLEEARAQALVERVMGGEA